MYHAPAFQLYAGDLLSNGNFMRMSLSQRGAYITLLAVSWIEYGLPPDIKEVGKLVGVRPSLLKSRFQIVLDRFEVRTVNGHKRLVNPRLEKERDKQRRWRQKSSKGGKKSAAVRRNKKR
jgi:uncharacterized protein YdaU (DUF1376 family)